MYYNSAIVKFRKILNFIRSKPRQEEATIFFTRAIDNISFLDRVVIEKSGANVAGLQNMNCLLISSEWFRLIEVVGVKYHNNLIEQGHRFIKQLARQMKGFKSFFSASVKLAGIEGAHIVRKQQFETCGHYPFKKFVALAG